MNSRHIFHLCLIAALCTAPSSKPMSAVCDFAPKVARIAGGSTLIGGALVAGCLSIPCIRGGMVIAKEQEKDEGRFFSSLQTLGLQAILGFGFVGAGAAALGTGIFSGHLGYSLLQSQFNSHSIVQAARLSSGIALLLMALSPLNSTRCCLIRYIKKSEFKASPVPQFAAATATITASLLFCGGILIKKFLQNY